jgi:hypothetical protein
MAKKSKASGGGGRTQARDSQGRFASGGGGGGKKAAPKTTTAKGRARTAEAKARADVKAGGDSKATRSLLTAQRARDYYKATGTGEKRSATKAAAEPKAAPKSAKPAKMSKAAPNPAKEKYKAARSQVRELKMYRGGKTDATVKKAEAKVKRMEKTRKSSRARI